jgi:hypothetical protein
MVSPRERAPAESARRGAMGNDAFNPPSNHAPKGVVFQGHFLAPTTPDGLPGYDRLNVPETKKPAKRALAV